MGSPADKVNALFKRVFFPKADSLDTDTRLEAFWITPDLLQRTFKEMIASAEHGTRDLDVHFAHLVRERPTCRGNAGHAHCARMTRALKRPESDSATEHVARHRLLRKRLHTRMD